MRERERERPTVWPDNCSLAEHINASPNPLVPVLSQTACLLVKDNRLVFQELFSINVFYGFVCAFISVYMVSL